MFNKVLVIIIALFSVAITVYGIYNIDYASIKSADLLILLVGCSMAIKVLEK